jgi:hypothetical protein
VTTAYSSMPIQRKCKTKKRIHYVQVESYQ